MTKAAIINESFENVYQSQHRESLIALLQKIELGRSDLAAQASVNMPCYYLNGFLVAISTVVAGRFHPTSKEYWFSILLPTVTKKGEVEEETLLI